VIPISTVNCFNCASNCGAYDNSTSSDDSRAEVVPYKYGCYPGPWYEVHHAAYLEGSPDTICFGIFYLFREDPTFLQWNYTFWYDCIVNIPSTVSKRILTWLTLQYA
jgi:hypothetical protein